MTMTTLLHISASPRGQHSESLAIAATFLEELRATQPDLTVEHWDLWDRTLPEFGPPAAAAKMAIFGGADPEGDQATAWRAARDTFERFDSADNYLFTVPMWNASVPYVSALGRHPGHPEHRVRPDLAISDPEPAGTAAHHRAGAVAGRFVPTTAAYPGPRR